MCGCFNPPTVAHQALLTLARNRIECEGYEVVRGLYVPTHQSYTKPDLALAEHRVEMCRLASEATDWIEVERHDVDQKEWCHLVETLADVQIKYPDCRLFVVCGSDLVMRWNDPIWPPDQVATILTQYGVIVAARVDTEEIMTKVPILRGREKYLHMIPDNPIGGLSSTKVRKLVRAGKKFDGMVIPAVGSYILSQHLYAE